MSVKSESSIGGYHSLGLPFFDENLDDFKIKTNSARSAIKIILGALSVKKIWLPAYICDAVVNAVKDIDVEMDFYEINECFDVVDSISLGASDYLLIVDYFGVSGGAVERSLRRYGQDNTIVDCSQAFFSGHAGALATIWSPRKFFGVPDGGLLYSDNTCIKAPPDRDTTSGSRMAHLINRLASGPEFSYRQYQEAEQAIAESPTLAMSHLTERLLCSVDYKSAKAARIRNAAYLHQHLSGYNKLNFELGSDTAPLCYPLLPNIPTINRSELINQRVFVPSYWPEVLTRVKEKSFEWELVTNGLFLPCDQRYTLDDMNRILQLLVVK